MGRNKNKKANAKSRKNTKVEKFSSSNVAVCKYHGLENQGATCYLNSVLQVLFMTKDFRDAVSSSVNPDSKCMDSLLSSLFNTLQKQIAKTQEITTYLQINKVSEQDDAAECFEKILNSISPEASKVFQGCLTHRNTCSKCREDTYDDQPFWSLPLPLVDSDQVYSVMDGIKHFFEESNITGENQMYCNQCNTKADTVIKAEMKQHPQVLTLLLKRFKFDYSAMKYVKICHRVEIPLTLPIPHNGGQSEEFELYACVQHSGELRHGHYTVNIKAQDDEKWYNFNDTTVTLISQKDIKKSRSFISQNAYLLFYRKNSLSQDITEISTTEGPKTDDKDKIEQDGKTKKRPVEEERGAADKEETDGSSRKTKRKRNYKESDDSKTVTHNNGGMAMNQKSRKRPENQQSKQKESKKDTCVKAVCNPPARCSEKQNGEEKECKRGNDQELAEQSESRCRQSGVDQDGGKSADAGQDASELKTVERKKDEEAEFARSQKTDKGSSKNKGRDTDSKTLTKCGKPFSKSQGKNSIVKERNSQNPKPDNSHRRQTASQKCHQVLDGRDGRETKYQPRKQNHNLEGEKDNSNNFVCNPRPCSYEEQNREEKCESDDQEPTEQSEDLCNQSEVDQYRGKTADATQDIGYSSTLKIHNLKTSEKHEEESKEEKVVNVSEDPDRATCTEIQGDNERMTEKYRTRSECRGSHRILKRISLCNDQTQKEMEGSVSMNSPVMNEEYKQALNDSEHIRLECCAESERSQDKGKLPEACSNKLQEDQEQEMSTMLMKETNDNLETKSEPRTDNVDTLSGCLNKSSQGDSSETCGNKYMNVKVETDTGIKSLTESRDENQEKFSLGAHVEGDSDKSHVSDRKGRKNKKGQNKQNRNIMQFGISSPRMKNSH